MTSEEQEERKQKLEKLRAYVQEGIAQARRGEFVELPSVAEIMEKARARLRARKGESTKDNSD